MAKAIEIIPLDDGVDCLCTPKLDIRTWCLSESNNYLFLRRPKHKSATEINAVSCYKFSVVNIGCTISIRVGGDVEISG